MAKETIRNKWSPLRDCNGGLEIYLMSFFFIAFVSMKIHSILTLIFHLFRTDYIYDAYSFCLENEKNNNTEDLVILRCFGYSFLLGTFSWAKCGALENCLNTWKFNWYDERTNKQTNISTRHKWSDLNELVQIENGTTH